MVNFLGVIFDAQGYSLQQIVSNADGNPVEKTSAILMWLCFDTGDGVLNVPITKIDIEMNRMVVTSQLLSTYTDRTRRLLKKTPRGTISIPFGAILQRR